MSEPSDKRRRTVFLFYVFYHFRRKEMKKILICVCIAAVAASGYLYWGNNSLTVSRYTIKNSKIPEGFNGYKIVQLSDVHNKDFNGRLSEKVRKLLPDIIVITGDLIDSRRTDISVAEKLIEELKSIAPIYYITGNHESRIESYPELREILESHGVTVLDGKTVEIEKNGGTINLTGIDDTTFFGSGMLNEKEIVFTQKLKELAKDKGENFGILLSHRPELIDIYADCGFDLAFTGHAHGGQIRLPFVGGILTPNQGFFPEYDAGEFKKGETTMIVSRGLGNSVFPFRIGNRPDIVLCELKGE